MTNNNFKKSLTIIIRNFDIDATDETGKTKSSSSSLTILTNEDMIIPIRLLYPFIHMALIYYYSRGTTVATYLHDDSTEVLNENLDSDSILKNKSQKNKQQQQQN